MQKKLKIIINKCRQLLSRFYTKYDVGLPYLITSAIALIIVISGIKLFIELTENLKTDLLSQFDSSIYQYIVSFRSPELTHYLVFITHVGDVYGYLFVFITCALSFYFIFKNWHYVGQLSLILILALSSNIFLKEFINRSRPDLEHLVTVETLSYPSGHAMTAMAFYGFLIYLFYCFNINKILKSGIIIMLALLIFSIGISRVYLGVHFPSDIVGGFIAGFIWVVFCALVFNIIKLFTRDFRK